MKDKEFKNWKYIVLIVLLCIIILLLSLVLFKVTNKNKEDNNLDKVYFLRQYLKSFEIGNNTLEKAKQFTKVAN